MRADAAPNGAGEAMAGDFYKKAAPPALGK